MDRDPQPKTINGLNIYTDGSKIDGHTGCAYVIFDKNMNELEHQSYYLGKYPSVFQAEVFAIYQAAKAAEKYNKNILFLSDSQSAIRAIGGHFIKSETVFETVEVLKDLLNNLPIDIELSYCQAHVGHQGNELADSYAKIGARLKMHGPEPTLPVIDSIIYSQIYSKLNEIWHSHWIYSNFLDGWEYRKTKIFFPHILKEISKSIYKFNREDLSLLLQNFTGHSFFNYHQNKVDSNVNPKCRLCNNHDETSDHILLKCEGLGSLRSRIFGLHEINWENPLSIKFGKKSFMPLYKIVQFLKEVSGMEIFNTVPEDHEVTFIDVNNLNDSSESD